jgi:hypothetical protein
MSSNDGTDDSSEPSGEAPDDGPDRGVETEFHRTDKEITRRPTKTGTTITLVAGAVATVFALFGGPSGFGVAVVGLAILGFGLLGVRQTLVDLGALVLFAGVALGALQGAPVLSVLLGTVASVVAWDAGGTAMSMGRQMGREAATKRAETVHALVGTAVGLVAIGGGYAIYRVAGGGKPTAALLFMLLAIGLLVSGLRI